PNTISLVVFPTRRSSDLHMKTLLITGGAGFIGANFVHLLHRERPALTLVVLDALTYAGNVHNLDSLRYSPRLHFVRGDIRDQALDRKSTRLNSSHVKISY